MEMHGIIVRRFLDRRKDHEFFLSDDEFERYAKEWPQAVVDKDTCLFYGFGSARYIKRKQSETV